MAAAIGEFTDVALNAIAVYLFTLILIGFSLNGLFLVVYIRDKTLHSPINVLFINLAVSDLMVGLFGTMTAFTVTVVRTLMTSEVLCQMYGFITFLGGMASMFSLMFIAVERFIIVVRPFNIRHLSYKGAAVFVGSIWLVALLFAGAPLVGLSRYTPEGAGMWCSIDWEDGDRSTTIYIVIIFTLGFFLPFSVMVVSYTTIFYRVRKVKLRVSEHTQGLSDVEKSLLRQTISMFAAYFLAWTPYAVVCLMSASGVSVSPRSAAVPALLAKSSFISNPVIYVLMNKQIRTAILKLLHCGNYPNKKSKVGTKHTDQPTVSVTHPDMERPPEVSSSRDPPVFSTQVPLEPPNSSANATDCKVDSVVSSET